MSKVTPMGWEGMGEGNKKEDVLFIKFTHDQYIKIDPYTDLWQNHKPGIRINLLVQKIPDWYWYLWYTGVEVRLIDLRFTSITGNKIQSKVSWLLTPYPVCFLPVTPGECNNMYYFFFFFLQNFEKVKRQLKFAPQIICQTQMVIKVSAKVNSYPSFLINDFYSRKRNIDPDPLLVLSLRPSSCRHSLMTLGKKEKL